MQNQDLSEWIHDHVFHVSSDAAERSTRMVMWVTAITMVIEVLAGWWFNSMALLADGWHMSSHAVAIGLTALAYGTARLYSKDPRFAFGTWKIEVLAGYSSALMLVGVAVLMLTGSIERIITPQPIRYQEAIVVTTLGLVVNIICALILGKAHHHHHHDQDHLHKSEHQHNHDHDHHHDLNLKSAYVHVIADAATSVLAIVALMGGWISGWSWLDPLMGIVGAALVLVWAKGLMTDTSKVLLDREMDHPVVEEIRSAVESSEASDRLRITDLHVWRVGKKVYSCAMTIVTTDPHLTPDVVRRKLAEHKEVVHSTIEIHLHP